MIEQEELEVEAKPLEQALAEPAAVEFVSVPAARYKFVFRVTKTIELPEFAGSAIRGVFGRALRRTACMTRRSDCKECPLYRNCAYTAIFETPPPPEHSLQSFSQIPNAYVVEPEGWGRRVLELGDELRFSVVLFGRARAQLPLVIYALESAMGFNISNGTASLESVTLCAGASGKDRIVYRPDFSRVEDFDRDTIVRVPLDSSVLLQCLTPLRLQCNGRPLTPQTLNAHALMMTLVRRISLVHEFQIGRPLSLDFSGISNDARSVEMQADLSWTNWYRYSNRQQRSMHLGGVTGDIILSNVSDVMRICLAAADLIHIGKNASFGLGKVVIKGRGRNMLR